MTADREPASIIGEFIDDAALMETGRSIGTVGSYRVAQALLTSDDPAVHAALLDALTNAGVLTEESRSRLIWEPEDDGPSPPLVLAGHANERRLATVWTEVQP